MKAVSFDVAPNPLLQRHSAGSAVARVGTFLQRYPGIVLILVTGVILVMLILLWQKRHYRSSKAADETESLLFKHFQQATATNDAAGSMQALIRWLDATEPGCKSATLSTFVQLTGDRKLAEEITRLEQQLYGRQSGAWSGTALYQAVKRARDKHHPFQHRHPSFQRYGLEPLNPGAAS